MLTMRCSIAIFVLFLGSLEARRLLQGRHHGTHTTALTTTTDPPSGNKTTPIIFMRPAYWQANPDELPWVYKDRGTGATMYLNTYTPHNAQTPNMPFRPLGSLVRCNSITHHTIYHVSKTGV